MLEDVCETIVWIKFGCPLGGEPPPKWPPQNETFELPNIKSWNTI